MYQLGKHIQYVIRSSVAGVWRQSQRREVIMGRLKIL